MRKDEYLKHLDQAFTQMPPELTASVEEAFRRGEKAVKQRHKIMTALSVAAALAILCAAIALAAGTLLKPRVDQVVATRGSGEGDGGGGASTADRGTLKPTHEPGPETSPVAQAYHGPDASQKDKTQTLTAETAIDWVKKLDEKAAKASGFWVFLSSVPNRAWVFYATDYDDRKDLNEGGAWYLGENSASLGYSKAVSDWTFCTPEETQGSEYRGDDDTYGIAGEHVACGPELFASVIRTGAGNRVHVWKVGEDGKVIELEAGERLCSIGVSGGALFGLTEEESGDRCFLRERDGQLYQVCGQPEEISAVEKLPGGKALLDELRGSGFTVADCLYRSMGADTEAEIITVNLEWEGKPCHAYLFRENAAAELDCERGWDDDIDVLSGLGSIALDAGLPSVTSGGIEATYMGRTYDANLAETARGATLAPAESLTCYATLNGRYYHADEHCGGMHNALPCALNTVQVMGKQPCPMCLGGTVPELTCYATGQGRYYHIIEDCSGMKGATGATRAQALAAGKQPCPVCLPDDPALYWATPQGTYYHAERECMGMRNARVYTEVWARHLGKSPCPECAGGETLALQSRSAAGSTSGWADLFDPTPEPTPTATPGVSINGMTFYSTLNGRYYHLDAQCGGMQDAMPFTGAAAQASGKAPCPVCIGGEADGAEADPLGLCYTLPAGQYYHFRLDCSGMTGARVDTVRNAMAEGKQPCPVCAGAEAEVTPEPTPTPVPGEPGELPVYYTSQGNYYHGDALCSGMRNAGAHTLAEAVDDGKTRCPVCQPGEPDDIRLFRTVFGCGLEELYPDARYAYTLQDAQTGVNEWMLCYPGDVGATYGSPVTMEDRTIRNGSDLPGHAGDTVPFMSVWTKADNALTVWQHAPEPLHGMLEEAEAALRDMPAMLAGIKSTPLEWLTRTVVTFDGKGEDILAVNLWFEGQEATTTFRWLLEEDGEYRMTLPEAVGEE